MNILKTLLAPFYFPIKYRLEKIEIEAAITRRLQKGLISSQLRKVDLRNPITWEFSGFSQNGEDGVIDVLLGQLEQKSFDFIEMACSNGLENNTSWLALTRQYRGVMVEGDRTRSELCQKVINQVGVVHKNMFVNKHNLSAILQSATTYTPDVFSLDLDGNDYHFAVELFKNGLRPKIAVVEYNAAFGPQRSSTITYNPTHVYSQKTDALLLYYGASVSCWKIFFNRFGYKFVTVDKNGINAFFVDPQYFHSDFLNNLQGTNYNESQFLYGRFKNWEKQYELFKHMSFEEIK